MKKGLRLILLGPPGAGKGTQAQWFCHTYALPHISTGDMLRTAIQSKSALGTIAQAAIEKGQLVSDDVIIQLIRERIAQPDCEKGFLLDGFPRTLTQAEALRRDQIYIDAILELAVPEAILIKRLSGRRLHPGSGRTYHIEYHPPKVADKDDVTGEPLIQREDDHPSVIQARLEVYHQQTQPLLHYYQQWAASHDARAPKLFNLAGEMPIEALHRQIALIIERLTA